MIVDKNLHPMSESKTLIELIQVIMDESEHLLKNYREFYPFAVAHDDSG